MIVAIEIRTTTIDHYFIEVDSVEDAQWKEKELSIYNENEEDELARVFGQTKFCYARHSTDRETETDLYTTNLTDWIEANNTTFCDIRTDKVEK